MSFVLPCRNEGKRLRDTVRALASTARGVEHEIIVVDNGSEDRCSEFLEEDDRYKSVRLFRTGPLGVTGARMYGFAEARREVVFFVDAHCRFSRGWLPPLLKQLSRRDVGVVAPAAAVWGSLEPSGWGMRWRDIALNVEWLGQKEEKPYSVPMVPGFCMGFRSEYFAAIGGFDSGMSGWGVEDLELCLRVWLLGQRVVLVPEAVCSHLFRPAYPYPVDATAYLANMLRAAIAHFSDERLERCFTAWKQFREYDAAYSAVMNSDILARREALFQLRKHDDEWFFRRFRLQF